MLFVMEAHAFGNATRHAEVAKGAGGQHDACLAELQERAADIDAVADQLVAAIRALDDGDCAVVRCKPQADLAPVKAQPAIPCPDIELADKGKTESDIVLAEQGDMAAIAARGPDDVAPKSACADLADADVEAADALKLAGMVGVIAVRNDIAGDEDGVPGGFGVHGTASRAVRARASAGRTKNDGSRQ